MKESTKWFTIAEQLNSDYNDYLRLADHTQSRIDSGWWPEFTLLSLQQKAASSIISASQRYKNDIFLKKIEYTLRFFIFYFFFLIFFPHFFFIYSATEASISSKETSVMYARLANLQKNITDILYQRNNKKNKNITNNNDDDSNSDSNNKKKKKKLNSLLIESSSSLQSFVGTKESLLLLHLITKESLKKHQSGRSNNRIELDQWMELGEKRPTQVLGYVQKTITQSLSHSLTTELSQVVTEELTSSL